MAPQVIRMKIREALPQDAEGIARTHLESWKTTYPGIVPQEYIDGLRVEKGIADWQARLNSGETLVLVAEDESGIFGFAAGGAIFHSVDGYDGELGAIYLLASHQRQGAGKTLVRRIAGGLCERGFTNMVVWALTANPACAFYERMGGVRAAEQMIEVGGVSLPEAAFGWRDLDALARNAESSPG
jgi:GNAT superfamily N-acetyltransferase